MPRLFARILHPSDPWFQSPGDVEELTSHFRGAYDGGISVCDTSICTAELALAAFYGNTTRLTPLQPAWLTFTDEEVIAAGGQLMKTPADPPWPPEYTNAHHDVVGAPEAVAAAMVVRALADPSRRCILDRTRLVCLIVELSQRVDVTPEFKKNTRRRVRRIHREENELFEQVSAVLPVTRTLLDEPK